MDLPFESNRGRFGLPDDCIGRSLGPVNGESGRANGPNNEGDQHAGGGDEEKWATADLVDEEASGHGGDQVEDLKNLQRQSILPTNAFCLLGMTYAIDQVLRQGVRVSDVVQNLERQGQSVILAFSLKRTTHLADVVGDEAVSRPLREETGRQQNEKPAAVSLGLDELEPSIGFVFLLQSQGIANFDIFKLHHLIVGVAVGMHLHEDVHTLLFLAVGNVPSGRLRHEPDEKDLDQRRGGLHDSGDTPRPVVRDTVGAIGQPGSDDATGIPGSVVDGGENGTMLRVSQFRNQERRSSVGDGNAETDEESGSQEHAKAARDGLQDDTDQHDDAADENTRSTAEEIRCVGNKGNGRQGTDGHDGVQDANLAALRVAEMILPGWEGLETVHHGAIISVFRPVSNCGLTGTHQAKPFWRLTRWWHW